MDLNVKPWRQKYLSQIWEAGLPDNLFRNKTHLLDFVRHYRGHFNSNVLLVSNKENLLALLFVEAVFLDQRTLNAYILPFKGFSLENIEVKALLFDIAKQYYDIDQKFEQVNIHLPDISKQVIPGNAYAIFLGDSVYPNLLLKEEFAAADFVDESFILFQFYKHHIIVTILDDYIVRVKFSKPQNTNFEANLKKALVRRCFLNNQGYIESNREIIKLISKSKPICPDLEIRIIEQFSNYLQGKTTSFDLPYKVLKATDFQKEVWSILSDIPYGNVLSYLEVAEKLTSRGKDAANYARAVGSACGKNPLGLLIPCHRVIGNDRSLTGFAGGTDLKGHLLDLEFLKQLGS